MSEHQHSSISQEVTQKEKPTLRSILLWCGAENPDDAFLQQGLERMLERYATDDLYQAYLLGCEDECLPEPLTKAQFAEKWNRTPVDNAR